MIPISQPRVVAGTAPAFEITDGNLVRVLFNLARRPVVADDELREIHATVSDGAYNASAGLITLTVSGTPPRLIVLINPDDQSAMFILHRRSRRLDAFIDPMRWQKLIDALPSELLPYLGMFDRVRNRSADATYGGLRGWIGPPRR